MNTSGGGGGDRSVVLSRDLTGASRSSLVVETPVISIMIPEHIGEAKDLFGDGTHTIVHIALRRSPESGDITAALIGNDLHGPSQLSNELLVGQRGTELMRPCVNSEVLISLLDRLVKLLGVDQHVGSDHEVGRRLVVLAEKIVQVAAVFSGAIVKADGHVAGRSIDNVGLGDAFGGGP